MADKSNRAHAMEHTPIFRRRWIRCSCYWLMAVSGWGLAAALALLALSFLLQPGHLAIRMMNAILTLGGAMEMAMLGRAARVIAGRKR